MKYEILLVRSDQNIQSTRIITLTQMVLVIIMFSRYVHCTDCPISVVPGR